jgi:acyl transferase domain-containing protein/acyl-CoA synthetase (AMP-forming)/AMP-acid ligase II/acyl carrier protein
MSSHTVSDIPGGARSVVEALQSRARAHAGRTACTFLVDGERREAHLTYGALDARARGVATHLLRQGARGERALLCLPTGLDFIVAFFGCLYAGTLAVPFSPLRRGSVEQARAVIDDAGARVALTTAEGRGRLSQDGRFKALRTILVDECALPDAVPRGAPEAEPATPAGVAYLQYTSGSTRRPRGVTITHGQLLQHVGLVWRTFDQSEQSVVVSWLPLFHDMGLVGALVAPLTFGARTILMSPWHFLTKPIRWLEAVSRHRATSSGAPNFAYDVCVARTTPEDRQGLDLASWTTAFNGAEPVRASTLDRFADAFVPHGFSRTAFRPCYGLAEATLLVSAGGASRPVVVNRIARGALESGRIEHAGAHEPGATFIVGCGPPQEDQRVRIVDPETRKPLLDLAVGEIWVAGPGLSTHYWNQSADQSTFGAMTSDGEGPFLRTGDLGYLDAGELFVTGRLKDLLTIRGRNHHAADLEASIQDRHVVLAATRTAVFTVDGDDGEALVVIQELPRGLSRPVVESVLASIRRTLSLDFGLSADSIVLVRAGSMPRTSSGKTMRYVCRQQFLAGQLARLDITDPVVHAMNEDPSQRQGHADESYVAMLDRLRRKLAAALRMEPGSVEADRTFSDLGVSSLQLAEIAGGLELELGRTLDPSILYSHPTLDALARYLTAGSGDQQAVAAHPAPEPIAITGLACRFPGATDAESFWDLLREGRDAISEVPPDRWNADESYDPGLTRTGTSNTKWGGFLTHVDTFDAAFFGISGSEADSMDPQQRLLLETSWEALEDAGLPLERVKGTRTGVFVGISTNDYVRSTGAERARADLFWCTGSALSIAANRVSYCLDLHGPSMAVDTACSSSLVALHLACRSLRAGESELALVGGVNVMLSPEITINMSQAGATSGDGRCKAFDARADGLVRGEGVGVVVLKPLSKALADQDRIYAVVRGTAINQDGATNGLTAPNPSAQAAVIRDAYDDAGLAPHSVQFVETHGPGTVLGDPIELAALASVVSGPQRTDVCRVGSVKTNIGHLEAAAGIAALIKLALALDHGQIPPSLHFAVPNPRIPFADHKLSVVTSLEPWVPLEHGIRRAGVSAFGFGGTNVHAVIESAPRQPGSLDVRTPTGPFHVVALSARSKPALRDLASTYCDRLLQAEDVTFARIARATTERRTRHAHRLAIVGESAQEIARRLQGFLDDNPDRLVHWGETVDGASAGPVFVFSGFEAAPAARFRELLKHDAFRSQIEACDVLTRRLTDWSIARAFERDVSDRDDPDAGLVRTQLRLFSLQVALAALWRAWGVEPAAVVGHSVGEIAAAHVADAIGLPDAFRILHERSRLLEEHLACSPGHGAMAAVRLSLDETRAQLAQFGGPVEIAAHNGPSLTVCAGRRDALDRLLAGLDALGVQCRLLALPGPGHTSFVEPVQQRLVDSLATLVPRPARVPIFSTASGTACGGMALDAMHWGRHLRAPVSFVGAIESTIRSGHRLFLEIGTQAALSPCITGVLRVARETGIAVPSLREQQSPHEALAAAAAHLFVGGYTVTWGDLDAPTPWASLPRYPWQRRRHWAVVPAASPAPVASPAERVGTASQCLATTIGSARSHPFLGIRLPGAPPVACWQCTVDPVDVPWLRDHRVGGMALVPATAYLKLAAEAARDAHGVHDVLIEDVEFERGLFVPAGEARVVQTTLYDHRDGGWRFEVHAAPCDGAGSPTDWTRFSSGRVMAAPEQPTDGHDLSALRARALVAQDPAALYDGFRTHGVAYGPSFARVEELWRIDEREALARVRGPASLDQSEVFDPGVLDACLQPMALTISAAETALDAAGSGPTFLPAGIRRARVTGRLPSTVWSHVSRRAAVSAAASFDGDATIFDDGGRVVALIEGFSLAPTGPAASIPLLRVTWQPRDSAPSEPRRGRWLILSDGESIGPALVRLMQARDVEAVLLPAGLDAHTPLEGVAGVVDLRVTAVTLPDEDGQGVARALARVCGTVLDGVRGVIDRSGGADAPAVWVVTRGAVAVHGEETPSPVQHPLWSLARTLAVEEARIWGGIVDLQPGASDEQDARALCATLLDADDEDQVAWRNGRRHVARLAPAGPATPVAAGLIHSTGTYLVTGGLGELGVRVASWLVHQGARRLILMGRTGLPPRAQWRTLPESPVARAVEIIRGLEAHGASIHLAQVDVSSTRALTDWLDDFRRDAWPDIRGVFHLAGIVRPAPLREVDESILMEHFSAKVAGAWNLHRYFRNTPLDSFVLFSSGSALLGSPGIGTYAAANGFLDALAAQRCGDGGGTVSINWGFWSESGMAARVLKSNPDRPIPRGIRGLTNRDALGILGTLLSSPHAAIGVMPFDWDEWAAAHPATAARRYLRLLTTARTDVADQVSISRDDILLAAPDERAAIVERYLSLRLARILQVDPGQLERDQPLTQLGIDSLMAVELKNRVEADLRTSVPIVALLQGGSIAKLARVVLSVITDAGPAVDPVPPGFSPSSPDADEARVLLSQLDRLPMAAVEALIERISGGDAGTTGQAR